MPLYAFSGDDDLRKQEALDAEVARWESSEPGEPPVREVHFGEELNAASVAESYETPDLFAPRKLLILRGYDKTNAAGRALLDKAFQSDNPQVAVFLSAEKLDGRQGWVAALKKAGRLFEFKLPYDNKIPVWLTERAQQRYGRKLSLADAKLLQEIVGNETSELDHELEKLDTFLAKGKPVSAEAIQDVVSPLKVHTMFEFQKAAGLKSPANFLPAMRSLLEQGGGESGIGATLMLFSHFFKLARIRSMLDEGATETQIVEACKLNPFLHIQKERYLDQARTRSLARWKQLLTRIARLESELKQGRYSQRFEIEMALAGVVLS
ncbi:MAG: holA [Fibrobacteria bacterium]|jgi:DNA polymerase III delta subunit|nr:holA [Fibrobacteria bacterium]